MAKITTSIISDKKEWENFIFSRSEANFLQSWEWGDFYLSLGNSIFRIGFYDNSKLIGLMLCIVENAKRGRYLIVPGGPIIDWDNNEVVESFRIEVTRVAKNEKCVFVRVRPQLVSSDFSKQIFKKIGFINAPMHLHAELTSQLDITKISDELLINMRKATRYEIKKAISLGIKISTTNDISALKKFYELQLITAKRQKFVPFSYHFLTEQFKSFSKSNNVLLYSAHYQKKLLAQAFIIFYNQEAAYHYGASTDEGRKYPGAYLIQWEAIQEAKRRGLKVYNFWGVAPEGVENHRFAGLSLFKRGFGGVDFEYLHAQDLVINKFKYLINFAVENVRRNLRRV